MIDHYLTVQCAGFITYCDALIARTSSDELQACFVSLVGTPAHIKASTAILFGGETCRISDHEQPALGFGLLGTVRSCRTRKIGETVNKVLVSSDYFPDSCSSAAKSAVVFGPDLLTVQERAFLRLDAATTIPLKPQWQSWLWDEVLQPEKLYSFGGNELHEAYLISWSEDDILQDQVLQGITRQYLI